MTSQYLSEILEQLQQTAANANSWQKRLPLLLKLDSAFSIADSENSEFLRDYYHYCCRKVLTEIRNWSGDTRIWKLYSSALLIKDPLLGVVAIDLNDGCTPQTRQTLFLLNKELCQDFAAVIDCALYTHSHLDHLGLNIVAALTQAKKTVIAPAEAIVSWNIDAVTAAEDCQQDNIHAFMSRQQIAGQDDCPNAAYLVECSGKNIFVRGDIYFAEDLTLVLDNLENAGLTIDLAAISPFYQSLPSPVASLAERFACNFVAIHEWEFGHRLAGTSGRATQTYADLYDSFAVPASTGQATVLTWGESMVLKQVKKSRDQGKRVVAVASRIN